MIDDKVELIETISPEDLFQVFLLITIERIGIFSGNPGKSSGKQECIQECEILIHSDVCNCFPAHSDLIGERCLIFCDPVEQLGPKQSDYICVFRSK